MVAATAAWGGVALSSAAFAAEAPAEIAELEPQHASSTPQGSGVVPALPLPGRSADPDRLLEAWSFFATPPVDLSVGPYHLLTDVEDRSLLASIAGVAASAQRLYATRYGVTPVGQAAETIVLYGREADYRALQDRSDRIRGLTSRGHVGWGMVVLFVPEVVPRVGANQDDVGAVLRHELAHLLNRRSLGPALPPWLDEGLADDLSAFELAPTALPQSTDRSEWYTPAPELAPRELPLDSLRTVDGPRTDIRGALASLDQLARAIGDGTVPALPSLLELDWDAFVEEPRAELHYSACAWLVRYLLDPRSGLDSEFRSFLRQVSRGSAVGARELEAALGREWSVIEAGWRRYVVERAGAAGVGSAPDASGRPSGSSSRQLDSPSA